MGLLLSPGFSFLAMKLGLGKIVTPESSKVMKSLDLKRAWSSLILAPVAREIKKAESINESKMDGFTWNLGDKAKSSTLSRDQDNLPTGLLGLILYNALKNSQKGEEVTSMLKMSLRGRTSADLYALTVAGVNFLI